MRTLYTLLFLCIFSLSLNAQTGTLDNTFATNGIYTVPGMQTFEHGAVAIDNQDRIYYAGSTGGDIYVYRLTPNGQVDNTWGAAGFIIVNFALNASVEDIIIQPDQKVLIGGSTGLAKTVDPIIVRLDTTGRQDITFASRGIFQYKGLNTFDRVRELGILSDGSIIALLGIANLTVGSPSEADYQNIGLLKLSSTGVQDATFGSLGTGIWNTAWAGTDWDRSSDMLIQSDDKIVVPSSFSQAAVGEKVHVFRFKADGDLDSTNFGENLGETGLYYLRSSLRNITSGIGIQASGHILVAGTYGGFVQPQRDFFVMRYTPDGRPDSTFALSSLTVTDFFGADDVCHDLVMQGNEFILLGEVDSAGTKGMGLARYWANGELDTTWGTKGLAFFAGAGVATEAALMSNGRIMVAGYSGNSLVLAAVRNNTAASVQRLNSDLSLNIFPNPFSHELNLSFETKINDQLSLDLLDMNGKVVQRIFTQQNFNEGAHNLRLNVNNDITKGMYVLHFYGKRNESVRTVIKK